jgi:glycosyltransferase involved in cell wall biosynthesis
MRVGFLNNQIDNRGTGNAVFDYAHYNETLLGNISKIYSFPNGSHDRASVNRYQRRFGPIYDINDKSLDIDVLYHIKSGHDDGFRPNGGIPYLVHSVFENHPHGDRYATVSKWMAERFSLPYVPHIIGLPDSMDDLRRDIGIPYNAIVFGRHGGPDTFDIDFAWRAIKKITNEREDIWFLFMNTNRPDIELNEHVVFVSPTTNAHQKRAFINSCDAMIHARSRGETFGISVGEFAFCGKPVITYLESPEKAHLQELGEQGLYYSDERMLYLIFDTFIPTVKPLLYDYPPEKVMAKFKEVFLDGIDTGS